jgi:hypothetical protein
VAADPIGNDNPIEEILLTGFPNPERKGCPPAEVIEALGNQKLGRDDAAWGHIWSCSPCFKDFKVIRDARIERVERAYRKERMRRRFLVAAAATVLLVTAGYFLVTGARSGVAPGFAVVSIDLSNSGVVRGAEPDGDAPVAQLPRRLDEIHLKLPTFSRHGRYVVAIVESRAENAAVALGSAVTKGSEAQSTIIVTLDLSSAKPGRYFLETRLDEASQQDALTYYPVVVSD